MDSTVGPFIPRMVMPTVTNIIFAYRLFLAPHEFARKTRLQVSAQVSVSMAERKQKNVLFLCTGNYYRSRFAEVLFDSVAAKMGLPWRASSRGLAIERGVSNIGPMAAEALEALEARGIRAGEAGARFPLPATQLDFQIADRVVALKLAEHKPLLQERFPDWAERVEWWHVDDAPEALALIEREVMSLVARILGGGVRPEGPLVTESGQHEPPAQDFAKKPITVKVGRETAGRRGKGVTTVFDLPLDEDCLRELAATLKQRCGTGGTVKDGRIEIQGDQRTRIAAELEKLGYKVKRVGG
jgi:predicted translation initiation factor SUI1